jgi:hypothetical protein
MQITGMQYRLVLEPLQRTAVGRNKESYSIWPAHAPVLPSRFYQCASLSERLVLWLCAANGRLAMLQNVLLYVDLTSLSQQPQGTKTLSLSLFSRLYSSSFPFRQ